MTSLSFDPAHATRDTLWQGQLSFWQPARGHGYRFNLDPVLLSGFVRPGGEHALELGAGCGVLSILLLAAGIVQRVTAVEIQPDMAAYALQNARDNGFADRMQVICGDLRTALAESPFHGMRAHAFDRIVFNPPYFPAHAGPPSPHVGRDIARHERFGTLDDFVRCAVHYGVAGDDGAAGAEISAIIRHARVQQLMDAGLKYRAYPWRLRYVQPRIHEKPTAGMVALKLCQTESMHVVAEPPLIVHTGHGRDFSDDVRGLLRER